MNAGLNVPFSGGLSSYSVFLMVYATYEQCQREDDAAANALAGRHVSIDNVESGHSAMSSHSVRRNAKIDTESFIAPSESLRSDTEVTSLCTNEDSSRDKNYERSRAASSLIDESRQRERSESASTISQSYSKRVQNGITEGRLFLHFLKLFGREFNPMKQGIGNLLFSQSYSATLSSASS